MATIAQNLLKLTAAKENIASAITDKGGTVAVSDGLEDFPTAIATIPSGGEPSGPTFTGDIAVSSLFHTLSMENLYLSYIYDYTQDGSENRAIWANFQPTYQPPWEWCITYIPRVTGQFTLGVLGTAGPWFPLSWSSNNYYYNPSVEVWENHKLWFGITEHAGSWDYSYNTPLSEDLIVGKSYSFIIGINSNGIYCRAIRNDTGAIIGQLTHTDTPQQTTYNEMYPAFLCNNRDTKFKLAGDIDLSKTYYKENGILIWGCDS